MKYLIHMKDVAGCGESEGYAGSVPWGVSPREKATVYNSMKEARKRASWLADRHHFRNVEIVPVDSVQIVSTK